MQAQLLSLALLLITTGLPQETPATAPPAQESREPLTRAQVEAWKAELEAATDVDEATRQDARGLYDQALEALEPLAAWRAHALESERLSAEAPGRLDSIRRELATPPRAPVPEVPEVPEGLEGPGPAQLQQLLARAQGELDAARKELADVQAETAGRAERSGVLPEELARVRADVAAAEGVLATPPSAPPANGPVERATRALRLARLEASRARMRMLERELESYEARKELLPARRDLATRRVSEAQALVNAWTALIAERRRIEAEQALQKTSALRQSTLEQLPESDELRELAREIDALAARRSAPGAPAVKLESARADLVRLRAGLEDLRARFDGTRKKVRYARQATAVGRILRAQYEMLPDPRELRRTFEHYREELSDAQLAQLQLEEDRTRFADVEREVERITAEGDGGTDDEELVRAARELLSARLGLVDDLIGDYELYLEQLVELEDLVAAKLALSEQVRTYVEERILWVKSVDSDSVLGSLPDLGATRDAARWALDPLAWAAAFEGGTGSASAGYGAAALVLLVVLFQLLRRRARRRIADIAPLVSRHRTDAFRLTLSALALTAVAAAPVPLGVWVAGRVLDWLTDGTALTRALVSALWSTARLLAPLCFLLALCQAKGVAESHFRWPASSVRALRKTLRALLPPLAAGELVFRFMAAQPDQALEDSLGRIAFVGVGVVASALAFRVLRPASPVLAEFLRRNPNGLVARTRLLWYPGAPLAPAALGVLALFGYSYTAVQLYERMHLSVAFGLLLVLLHSLLSRWLFHTRRKLAVERARQLAQARAAAAASDTPEGGEATVAIDEDQLDIPALDAQTRQLFRSAMLVGVAVGLYFIWVGILPALKGLDRITVYPRFAVLAADVLEEPDVEPAAAAPVAAPESAGSAAPLLPLPGLQPMPGASPAGAAGAAAEPELVVTLADVLLSVLVLVLTAIAALNFPALLEIALLQRLPMDAGARYAITTVCRYAIAILGISSAMGALGIGWAKIQWLAAALTFGLAFGLQEIFANFISGLIILVERPIRLGDIVTVGGIEGQVSRIRIRATTITDWDRRELLVPNREFITQRVINWTLSDPITRIVVPVGIAYGSDTRRATELLLRCARESPRVLDDPAPSAIFQLFGDSSLNFHLRVFIPSRDAWPEVVHDLHTRIDDAFRAAGIEIAFPQRDLHIRSSTDLPVETAGERPARPKRPARSTDG